MSSSDHAVTTLHTLLRADPELKASLQEAADLDQFARIAADSARRHGTTLDAGDLRAQIEISLEQASAATAEPHVELTDQQMEKVVGATSPDPYSMEFMLQIIRDVRAKIDSINQAKTETMRSISRNM